MGVPADSVEKLVLQRASASTTSGRSLRSIQDRRSRCSEGVKYPSESACGATWRAFQQHWPGADGHDRPIWGIPSLVVDGRLHPKSTPRSARDRHGSQLVDCCCRRNWASVAITISTSPASALGQHGQLVEAHEALSRCLSLSSGLAVSRRCVRRPPFTTKRCSSNTSKACTRRTEPADPTRSPHA